MALPAQDAEGRDYDFDWVDEEGRYHGLDMTCPFNSTGQCPALSVPAGFTEEGLPVGLQIVTNRFEDTLALRIGAALEAARPWAERRPEI
jgi:Asp-tRNA(Asn)/Glu-tRNA(Gln) amidotransferase A subunit family amidase